MDDAPELGALEPVDLRTVWSSESSDFTPWPAKRLALLLDCLAKMQSWLRYQGRGELQACDRAALKSGFRRLVEEARRTAEAGQDFVEELRLP